MKGANLGCMLQPGAGSCRVFWALLGGFGVQRDFWGVFFLGGGGLAGFLGSITFWGAPAGFLGVWWFFRVQQGFLGGLVGFYGVYFFLGGWGGVF